MHDRWITTPIKDLTREQGPDIVAYLNTPTMWLPEMDDRTCPIYYFD